MLSVAEAMGLRYETLNPKLTTSGATMQALEARGLLLSDTAPCLGCGKLLAEHVGGRCPDVGERVRTGAAIMARAIEAMDEPPPAPTLADVERARLEVDNRRSRALGLAEALVVLLERGGKSEALRADLAGALADYRAASDRHLVLLEARIAAKGR